LEKKFWLKKFYLKNTKFSAFGEISGQKSNLELPQSSLSERCGSLCRWKIAVS